MISSPQLARIRIPALVLLALMAFYLVNLSFVDAAKDYEDYEYEDDDDDDDDDVPQATYRDVLDVPNDAGATAITPAGGVARDTGTTTTFRLESGVNTNYDYGTDKAGWDLALKDLNDDLIYYSDKYGWDLERLVWNEELARSITDDQLASDGMHLKPSRVDKKDAIANLEEGMVDLLEFVVDRRDKQDYRSQFPDFIIDSRTREIGCRARLIKRADEKDPQLVVFCKRRT